MTVNVRSVLAITLFGAVLSSCNHDRGCKGAETADLFYTLGMGHALVWKSPHGGMNKIYVTQAVQHVEAAQAKLNAAGLPKQAHAEVSQIIAQMKGDVAAMQSQIGGGPVTPANTGPTGEKLQTNYGKAIEIVRTQCRK